VRGCDDWVGSARMRSRGRLVAPLVAAVLSGWGLAWAAPRVPGWLAEVGWLRVRRVAVEGVRYLSAEEVERAAGVPAEANLWEDTAPVAARVRSHPLVRDAHVRRKLPGTLVVQVDEREPIALVPTPTLEPIDREGRLLPIDPARHALDLPVLRPGPVPDVRATREAARLAELDPEFWSAVSVVTAEGAGDLTLEWGDPPLRIRLRTPVEPVRLREARAVLADLTERSGRRPAMLDLRFADQVVVRPERDR
jgi:cell division septal protein FtsQ